MCEYCGKNPIAKGRRKYCSDKCRRMAAREAKRVRDEEYAQDSYYASTPVYSGIPNNTWWE